MTVRIRNALVVFAGLVATLAVVYFFDFTDSYITSRFKEGVENARPGGDTFSLDAFMNYYDWDSVCLVLPGSELKFKTRAGTGYRRKDPGGQDWSLVFVKQGFVVGEIPIKRSFLAYPNGLSRYCFDRWEAVFSIEREENGQLRLSRPGI